MTSGDTGDLVTKLFKSKTQWAGWLDRNHTKSSGIWLEISKKGASMQSVTYKEALDVALCHGWIDGQKKAKDEQIWLQRFLPRAPRSLWSKVNREKALHLIASGEMQPAGLEAIEKAKQDGRWNAAYDSPKTSSVPEDFQSALDRSAEASAFFESLNKANRYALLWRIQTVKRAETRARKITEFIAMLERKEKFH